MTQTRNMPRQPKTVLGHSRVENRLDCHPGDGGVDAPTALSRHIHCLQLQRRPQEGNIAPRKLTSLVVQDGQARLAGLGKLNINSLKSGECPFPAPGCPQITPHFPSPVLLSTKAEAGHTRHRPCFCLKGGQHTGLRSETCTQPLEQALVSS